MLRLTLILCIGLFAALMIAGEDRGQLRPGLAEAAARRVLPDSGLVAGGDSTASVRERDAVVRVDATRLAPAGAGAKATGKANGAAVVARAAVDPVLPAPVAPAATPAAPAAYVEPARDVVTAVKEPIFSLSSVGSEPVPTDPSPEVADGGAGTIWYVIADSVNVRAQPSLDAEVLGKLGTGEATLLVEAVDDEWARIVIEGDGVEGYVARRFLSAKAP